MIRIPPAFLEQIPAGVVKLCDHYPQTKPKVWCIQFENDEESKTIRIDVNRSAFSARLTEPDGDKYLLASGEIQIWIGKLPIVLIRADGAWSYFDIKGFTLEQMRKMLDGLNRIIWRVIADKNSHVESGNNAPESHKQ